MSFVTTRKGITLFFNSLLKYYNYFIFNEIKVKMINYEQNNLKMSCPYNETVSYIFFFSGVNFIM